MLAALLTLILPYSSRFIGFFIWRLRINIANIIVKIF